MLLQQGSVTTADPQQALGVLLSRSNGGQHRLENTALHGSNGLLWKHLMQSVVAGQEARFVDAYAEIGEVPESLLMNVDWEENARTNQASKRVRGRTAPGAHVTARGIWGERSVYAREDGFFDIEVPLEEGDNRMDLMAEDALGRQSPVVRVALPHLDTRGPEFEGEVDYGD